MLVDQQRGLLCLNYDEALTSDECSASYFNFSLLAKYVTLLYEHLVITPIFIMLKFLTPRQFPGIYETVRKQVTWIMNSRMYYILQVYYIASNVPYTKSLKTVFTLPCFCFEICFQGNCAAFWFFVSDNCFLFLSIIQRFVMKTIKSSIRIFIFTPRQVGLFLLAICIGS